MRPLGRRSVAVLLVLVLVLAGCGGGAGGDRDGGGGDGTEGADVQEPELRRELLAMQEDDQRERTSDAPASSHDEERTRRLVEILDRYGWPGRDLVGEDGSTAAWVIAQHSDLDPEAQARALEHLRTAVEDGQASPGDLAYLEDRVAAGAGRPQVYGTQIGCVDGEAQVGDLVDPERVDERRAEAGLGPLAEYLEELRPACEEEAAAAEARGAAAGDAG